MADQAEVLNDGMRSMIAIGCVAGVMFVMYALGAQVDQTYDDLPRFPFNPTSFYQLMESDCISGAKKNSFSVQKMNAIGSSAVLPCYTDNLVEFKAIIYSSDPYPTQSWEFRSSGFTDDYLDPHNSIFDNPYNNPINDPHVPKSLYRRAILLEDSGRFYPGAIIVYGISVQDFDCTYGDENTPCE